MALVAFVMIFPGLQDVLDKTSQLFVEGMSKTFWGSGTYKSYEEHEQEKDQIQTGIFEVLTQKIKEVRNFFRAPISFSSLYRFLQTSRKAVAGRKDASEESESKLYLGHLKFW